ncbi:RNase P modulator RnpM [Clostridium tetani]|uniref:YlxR family protein n=1 Tax=Clostridium tetani TaxID=1513 RepID=A0ABY0EL43_CLOTA|nr:YlxR family protein [Clostridium tetani]KHO39409.1 nucleic-acid-binding protein implicated in transcription termination [Clostridium tetani]RXI37861.1 YlxR family protein [Clostridium tetani]RXI51858.1 YlxR family protein [Clostridium tetani]RXI74143.1 YlxR family protein [Clostridium tetani]
MKTRKIPQRMCTGCMEMKPKKELIRVVRNKEGEVSIDLTGKKSGRGAYICKDVNCLQKSFKTRRLEKNLEATISEELFNKLKEEIKNEG